MLRPARGPRIHALSAALFVGMLSGAVRADETQVDSRLAPVLRSAVTLAAARLRVSACAAVVGDFRDEATGHPLTERLGETGQTASEYFSHWLTFASGFGLRPCKNSERIAYTSPGSRVVFVCPDQFRTAWRKNEGTAANVLIHEALHSLGLGENPPDSKAITAQVQARCGR